MSTPLSEPASPMSSPDSTETLNRVLALLRKSLPQYLRYARPYIPRAYRLSWQTVQDIAAAQEELAERIAEQILSSGGLPDDGEFPTEFTDTHDLGIDYLIRQAVGYQRQDVELLESLAATPGLEPTAQSLVAEALGLAKGHLESLAAVQPIPGTPGSSTVIRDGEPAYKND